MNQQPPAKVSRADEQDDATRTGRHTGIVAGVNEPPTGHWPGDLDEPGWLRRHFTVVIAGISASMALVGLLLTLWFKVLRMPANYVSR